MKQLIKRILREEFRNLSLNIEELLQPTVDKYSDYVCGVQVFQDVMNPKKYSLRVIFVGGSGSKGWPMTQAIHSSREKVMKEMWETIYKFTGLSVELGWTHVTECDKGLFESLEDIQGTPLYHYTSESRALSIMNSNMLRGTRPDDDILAVDPTLDNTPHQSMVSLTRDKNFVPNETIGASAGGLGDSNKLKVIFVVDKDKLKSNYKIVPFDYSSLEDRWYDKRMKDEPDTIMQPRAIRTSKSNEYEERVLTNKIQPLRRYVTDIIYKGDNPLVQEKIDEFLGRRKQEQNESELTERCWKGYTQKGMKTMFGKRYPNCVKVKKESVNEASLADYLKKLVSSTRPDPMRDFQKVVDLITKVTKREVPVEGLVGVQVVDTNKQMWGANYMDDKDIGRRWDFTVVLRLVFTSEKDFDESDRQIIKFKDEFTNNAYGMGLMNTSPITNKKVKDYKVNFMFDMKYPFVISQQM